MYGNAVSDSIQFGVISVTWIINNVETKFSICFVFHESPVFLGKGNGLREAFQ
jgi:hypothetical protein